MVFSTVLMETFTSFILFKSSMEIVSACCVVLTSPVSQESSKYSPKKEFVPTSSLREVLHYLCLENEEESDYMIHLNCTGSYLVLS